MIKHKGFFLAGIFSALILAACDRILDDKEQGLNLEYLSFTNHGCQGQEALSKANSSTPYLVKHRMVRNTLTLTIHHGANCCPAFVDSVSIHDTMIDICIEDTLRGCLCFCEYENDFAFQYAGSDRVRVRFGWMGEPFELDTLVQLP